MEENTYRARRVAQNSVDKGVGKMTGKNSLGAMELLFWWYYVAVYTIEQLSVHRKYWNTNTIQYANEFVLLKDARNTDITETKSLILLLYVAGRLRGNDQHGRSQCWKHPKQKRFTCWAEEILRKGLASSWRGENMREHLVRRKNSLREIDLDLWNKLTLRGRQ